MSYVPIIDLDRDPAVVGVELDDVCRNVGFFQVVGHGVDDAVAQRAWDATVAFFDQPLAERLATRPPGAGYPYGYIPFSGESLSKSLGADSKPDLKEAFSIGPVGNTAQQFGSEAEAWAWQPNLWPPHLPGFEKAWSDYFAVMLGLGSRLMELFAVGLSLPTNFFAASIDRSPSSLRAIRYPARTARPNNAQPDNGQPSNAQPNNAQHDNAQPDDGQLRAGAHTDYGTLTILRQDAIGGLQVRTLSDEWAAVDSVPGAFVINIGDLMARWTNDRWRSTLHRVVDAAPNAHGQIAERHSMPFFHNANWDAEVTALPTCVAAGERPKYGPVLAGPHLQQKFTKATAPASV